MKFTHVCLLVLIALIGLNFVSATQREVRSYTNEMEYVDQVNSASEESPVADHSMMETESDHSSNTQTQSSDDSGNHFSMESEAEEQAEDEFGIHSSFLEADAASDVDTESIRAMALEIHDFAQSHLDDDGEVVSMIEAESETEAESEVEADPSGLTPAELAQEAKDKADEKKAKAAEAADNKEEAAAKKEAAADAKIIAAAVALGVGPKGATAAPAAASSTEKTVVTLPADLSAEHAETIRVNEAATETIKGALGQVGGILQSKDDTIRSLVFNISYLTVNIGKLASKVDLQKSYIGLLRNKLHLANLKNKELHDHVEHSADTVVSIRSQLKQVEERLNTQDKTTAALSDFLTKNQDKIELPALADDLEIRGTPVVPGSARLARRVQRSIRLSNSRLRPVEGTQVYADAHAAFIPAQPTAVLGPQFFPSSYFGAPASASAFFAPGMDIPTIVVEANDDGN